MHDGFNVFNLLYETKIRKKKERIKFLNVLYKYKFLKDSFWRDREFSLLVCVLISKRLKD